MFKGIISITSYKKRIDTISKTLFSLIENCKGFHIVLVLSSDEFKDTELPKDLQLLINNNLVELLWTKENTYTFKKMLPTMEKYPDYPIITADDGCRYTCNYAETLYNLWNEHKDFIVSFNMFNRFNVCYGGGGSGILFPPNCFKIKPITQEIINTKHDDYYYGCLAVLNKCKWLFINRKAKDTNFINFNNNRGVSGNFKNENAICQIIKKELGL